MVTLLLPIATSLILFLKSIIINGLVNASKFTVVGVTTVVTSIMSSLIKLSKLLTNTPISSFVLRLK